MRIRKIKGKQRTFMCVLIVIMFCLSLIAGMFASAMNVSAADRLKGKLTISYSPTNGKLTAVYDGTNELSGGEVYTWFKDGSTAGTGPSYMPTAAGTYYCVLRDFNSYEGTLTSSSITLYRAVGSQLTFDNVYGLYESGSSVNVTAELADGETVVNWKVSAQGVTIPQNGQTVTFRMPAQNITVTATIKKKYIIKVYGGTADTYEAFSGETVTLTASSIEGKQFVSWSVSGGRIGDSTQSTTTLTVSGSNVVATANFKGTVSTQTPTNNTPTQAETQYTGKADAKHAVYKVINGGGYNVKVEHHSQGPLADAAFKYAQGNDWLVTDYFNIVINNSFTTYEIASPITIELTIPDDLVVPGRKWRMVCVSRNGSIYSFPDTDYNDSTITFSPDRFYAYAMCYNDIPDIVVEEPVEEEPVEEEPVKETTPTSELHSAGDSQTKASAIHSADASVTTNTTGVATAASGENAKIKSDQTSAVERANGATVALISM